MRNYLRHGSPMDKQGKFEAKDEKCEGHSPRLERSFHSFIVFADAVRRFV